MKENSGTISRFLLREGREWRRAAGRVAVWLLRLRWQLPLRSYDSKTMEHARKNDVEGFTGERFSDYVEDSEKYSAKLMPGMIPTAEEADQVSPFLTDSDSYVQEARMKFVTGQWNFDSDWDAYVNQLNVMGAEDYVTVKQAQYDRYLSK